MKRLLFLSVLFLSAPAYADMVEVKGEGFLNGEVLSDDGKKITFKDPTGNVRSFDKKNVTFMEIDKSDTGKKSAALGKTLKVKAAQALEAAKKAPQAIKQATDGATKGFTESVGKPIDRSGADARSAQLAKSMDEASRAAVGVNKTVLTANEEIARQQKRSEQGEDRVISKGGYVDNYDAKKGRFGSL